MSGKNGKKPAEFTLEGPAVQKLEIRYDTSTQGVEIMTTADKQPVLYLWLLLVAAASMDSDQLMFGLKQIVAALASTPAPKPGSGMEEVPPGTLVEPRVGPQGVSREALELARKKAGGN